MILALIFVAAFSLLVVFAACKVSGDCAREEETLEEECACENCLRWSECNGVDEQCPHRKVNGENEQN